VEAIRRRRHGKGLNFACAVCGDCRGQSRHVEQAVRNASPGRREYVYHYGKAEACGHTFVVKGQSISVRVPVRRRGA
jgi:hypothetical protein